jgi:cytochrome b subunit of formate dehydrogenase
VETRHLPLWGRTVFCKEKDQLKGMLSSVNDMVKFLKASLLSLFEERDLPRAKGISKIFEFSKYYGVEEYQIGAKVRYIITIISSL